MLTKLGETLTGWTPRRTGGDALSRIRAAWVELVGMDVARAAQPVAIAGDALVVVTASAAWSHQLAFLEATIVRGVRALVGDASVARVRFRVGVIRANVRGVARAPSGMLRRRASTLAIAPPRTAHDALARFRAAVERRRAAHRARGGVFCEVCAAPIARGRHCLPCANWARLELEARCQRLLFDAPWLTPEEVLQTLPGLDAAAYDAIRRRLLRTWWDEMNLARKRAELPRPIAPDRMRLRKIASSFVLLETKIDPKRLELDSPIRRNALGDVYDFICSVERDRG